MSIEPNLYVSVKKLDAHTYLYDSKASSCLALSRILVASSVVEIFQILSRFVPRYRAEYLYSNHQEWPRSAILPARDPASIFRRAQVEYEQTALSTPELMQVVERLIVLAGYSGYYLSVEQTVWMVQPDLPLVSLPNQPYSLFPFFPFFPYPPISLGRTQLYQGQEVLNLQILAARGWDEFLFIASSSSPSLNLTEAQQINTLIYALPYPRVTKVLKDTPGWITVKDPPQLEEYRTPGYQAQLRVEGRYLVNFDQVFFPIKFLENGTGYLVKDKSDQRLTVVFDSSAQADKILQIISSYPLCDSSYPCFNQAYYLRENQTDRRISLYRPSLGSTLKKKAAYYHSFGTLLPLTQWLVAAVERLHRLKIVHRNLRLETILVAPNQLIGFSQAQRLDNCLPPDRLPDIQAIGQLLQNLWTGPRGNSEKELRLAQVIDRMAQPNPTESLTSGWTDPQGSSLTDLLPLIRPITLTFFEQAVYQPGEKKILLNLEEALTVEKLLGEGGFGRVDLVRDSAGNRYALKTESASALAEDTIIPRISKYPNCNPDLICVYETFYFTPKPTVSDKEDWERAETYSAEEEEYLPRRGELKRGILYEYIDGVEIADLVNLPDGKKQVVGLFPWLVRTVKNLHDQGIVHHDISPFNIMRDTTGHYKLIDFGLACVVPNCKLMAGNYCCMAPEMKQYTNQQIDFPKTDIYSIGSTMKLIFQHAQTGTPLEKKLANQMVDPNPAKRPTLEEALIQLTT